MNFIIEFFTYVRMTKLTCPGCRVRKSAHKPFTLYFFCRSIPDRGLFLDRNVKSCIVIYFDPHKSPQGKKDALSLDHNNVWNMQCPK